MEREVLVTSCFGRGPRRQRHATGKPRSHPDSDGQDRFIGDYFVNSVLLQMAFRAARS